MLTRRAELALCWGLLALALVASVQTVAAQWSRIGQPIPGFGVMKNLLVAVGGLERAGLAPFDLVRAMNGRLLASGREIQAEVERHPPGTKFRYIVSHRGKLIEAEIASTVATPESFHHFLLDGLLPGLLYLALGAIVMGLKPCTPEARRFLAFCLAWLCVTVFYLDAFTTYRFSELFLTAWAFLPAVQIHLAVTFPERRRVFGQRKALVWAAYVSSALLAVALHIHVPGLPIAWMYLVPALGAVDWGASLILLILALVRTSLVGATALVRQRARVLATGFAVGQLAPVLATTVEAAAGIGVPYLEELWRLNFLFPLTVAYAMVRYNLFDLRAVIRIGTIYAAVTGLVVLAYAGAITLVNLAFSSFGLWTSQIVPAVIVALAVVLFLNPVYVRTQAVVDRVFFRQRLDVQRSIERLADTMTTLLDLPRIVQLITGTVDSLLRPARCDLLILDESRGGYRGAAPGASLPADAALARVVGARRMAATREQIEEAPEFRAIRAAGLAELDALGAELVMPVLFRGRPTGLLLLGPRLSGLAYTTEDLRLLRLLANQSAVALENAKAYTALQTANAELQTALRRVEILESIRASLSKFVPRTVQELIEQDPAAPELAKRELDVSVLFVDIAGYTRLSERFDMDKLNYLVERYFGAFLDEILRHGGDVNETAGDGLMVIFQDPDGQGHARSAVRMAVGIIGRARQINGELAGASEPITLHVGVNSGVAAVGATKIEGVAGTRWTYTASGSVTNVAARLASLGAGEAVFVGPETERRLQGEFPLHDLGEQRLRNVEESVRVWRLAVEPADATARMSGAQAR